MYNLGPKFGMMEFASHSDLRCYIICDSEEFLIKTYAVVRLFADTVRTALHDKAIINCDNLEDILTEPFLMKRSVLFE